MSIKDNTTHSLQVVSGSSSTSFTYPNLFTLQLPTSGFTTGNDEIALKTLTVYYSWPNVSAVKGNNAFAYVYAGVNYPVVMGDGIYSYVDINTYLTQVMVANGHYFVDEYGVNQVYIKIVVNPMLYCLSLSVLPIPTTLPVNWTNPAAFPLSGSMQLRIIANFATLTGFKAGLYPSLPMTTLYQVNSAIPQITDVTSLNITSNVVNSSSFSLSPNTLASFVVPNNQQPGSQIQFQPTNLDWVGMQKMQTFTTVTIAIVNQLLQPVTIRDPSGFCAVLNIRRRN